MLELIQQNPIASLIILLIPIVGGTWKVFEVLFVKPRDFRIAVLEKSVDELRKEFQRSSTTPNVLLPTNGAVIGATIPTSETTQTEKIEALMQGTTLLNDLPAFYESWREKSLTELQRDQFEKSYLGQKIVWRARLGDVSEEQDGLLWVSLKSENERDYGVHVIAVFESKYKEALLMTNKGEAVTVSGVIDRFFLSPLIKDCTITRNA